MGGILSADHEHVPFDKAADSSRQANVGSGDRIASKGTSCLITFPLGFSVSVKFTAVPVRLLVTDFEDGNL